MKIIVSEEIETVCPKFVGGLCGSQCTEFALLPGTVGRD